MSGHDFPIDAILAGLTAELSFATTIERLIHGQEFLPMDLGNHDLYTNYKTSFTQRYRTVAELLRQSQERGELSKDLGPEEFAHLLQLIQHGAGSTGLKPYKSKS